MLSFLFKEETLHYRLKHFLRKPEFCIYSCFCEPGSAAQREEWRDPQQATAPPSAQGLKGLCVSSAPSQGTVKPPLHLSSPPQTRCISCAQHCLPPQQPRGLPLHQSSGGGWAPSPIHLSGTQRPRGAPLSGPGASS